MILQTKDKRVMKEIRDFPKYCLVCGSLEVDPTVHPLIADDEKHLFTVYLCKDHIRTTSEQIQEIVSDNINLANF